MQTIVLCEIFARFRGKRAMIKPSEPFRSLYSRVSFLSSPYSNFLSLDFVTYSRFQDSLFSLVFSSPSSQWYPYSTSPQQVDTITQSSSSADADTSFGSVDSTSSVHRHASITPGSRWAEWTEAEARRRLLAACFVLDVHTSVYYDLPLMRQFTKPCPPIPLITASQPLWNATPQEWEAMTSTGPTTFEPMVLAGDIISRSRIANSVPLDQAVFLASEALRMPKRPNYNLLVNLIESPRLENVERILALFPGSGVAYTYTALHYTPLHDLLAVSGDSWLFSQKILESKSFVLHQRTLKHWSSSLHAATAAKFAAKALIAYLTINDNGMSTTPSKRQWNMADISDYWAVYVGALICWAIGFRNTTPTRTDACAPSSQGRSVNDNPGKDNNENGVDELEALSWLHVVAEVSSGQDIMTLVNARGRAVVIAIVAMVRRRLEAEAIGSRSRLLVDAVGVLKKLEEGINWIWF